MAEFQNNSIFWVEVEKIVPNPYQPRREFDETRLKDLAESIRMYGVLQPLTVTRKEQDKEDGGLAVEYELIAGERRLRASRLAGLSQVPVIIRSGPEDAKIKLELAIIENLQREDLNPIDRARAFAQLADEFNFTHVQIAKKVGKSREYVSNSIRLLQLPEEIQLAIVEGRMSEGHARPIMMLRDKPAERDVLFKEVVYKKITVREAEKIARNIAKDKVRKQEKTLTPELVTLERKLSESLGTRVHIEQKPVGGQLVIDFFSAEDLKGILDLVNSSLLKGNKGAEERLNSTTLNKKIIEAIEDASTLEEEVAPHVTENRVSKTPVLYTPEEKEIPSVSLHDVSPIATVPSYIPQLVKEDPVFPDVSVPTSQKISELGNTQEPESHEEITLSPGTPETVEDQEPMNVPSKDESSSSQEEDLYGISNFTI